MMEKKVVREGKKKGLIIVNTGNGKGKTTAALGVAFRAIGSDFKVFVGQFIKGSREYGELVTADRLKEKEWAWRRLRCSVSRSALIGCLGIRRTAGTQWVGWGG